MATSSASAVRPLAPARMIMNRPLEDWEYPDPDDDDDGEVETVACPSCGVDVYEEAQQCPHCGQYIDASTLALAGRSWWFIALGIAGIAAVVTALL